MIMISRSSVSRNFMIVVVIISTVGQRRRTYSLLHFFCSSDHTCTCSNTRCSPSGRYGYAPNSTFILSRTERRRFPQTRRFPRRKCRERASTKRFATDGSHSTGNWSPFISISRRSSHIIGRLEETKEFAM